MIDDYEVGHKHVLLELSVTQEAKKYGITWPLSL